MEAKTKMDMTKRRAFPEAFFRLTGFVGGGMVDKFCELWLFPICWLFFYDKMDQ